MMLLAMLASSATMISLQTPSGTLSGTLAMPAERAPVPLVVFIAGSGPTDRDGNSRLLPGQNNSTAMLAEALAAKGIASLRYDKRGIGESAKAMVIESELRFDTYAEDAALWVRKLRADARFSTITIAGHSEGSLLGMLAAQRAPVDGFVSIAGAGQPADRVLREQLGSRLPPDLLAEANKTLDALVAGHTVETFPPQLVSLFRPSVQPYLISWFRVDPQKEIAALRIPVLIAQGTFDAQVSPADAALLAKAQPHAKLVSIEGMNHVLKKVAKDQAVQQASYGDPSLPVAPELIEAIAAFVKPLKLSR
jgi:pimeloyl-ACP methyl ester carboxylesterase